jgi:hypothetical protein
MFMNIVRKAGAKQTSMQSVNPGDPHSFSVEKGPFALLRMKELIEEWDIDHSHLNFAFHFKPDGDTETGKPMKIIGRPIQGIDNPLPRGFLPFKRALLRQNIMVWESI